MKWKKGANCGSFTLYHPEFDPQADTTGNVKIYAYDDGRYQVSADSDLFDLMINDNTIFPTFTKAKEYAEKMVEKYRKIMPIYRNLMQGKRYVELIPKVFVREDVWQTVLSFGYDMGDGKPIWRWHHFGSSANRATIDKLEWIIRVIFETTPEEFEKKYELK